jgi:amino acid permease
LSIYETLQIDLALFQKLLLKISRKSFVENKIDEIYENLKNNYYTISGNYGTTSIKQAKANLKICFLPLLVKPFSWFLSLNLLKTKSICFFISVIYIVCVCV